MAIGTNAAIEAFGTAATSLGNTPSAVSDGAFSDGTNDLNAWTNADDAPWATLTLKIDWNTTAPDTGSFINLYARKTAVQSTNNDEVPSASFLHTFLGFFSVDDVLTEQFITIDVRLPNWKTSSIYHFYIENKTGEACEASWDLYITPKTIGPHA